MFYVISTLFNFNLILSLLEGSAGPIESTKLNDKIITYLFVPLIKFQNLVLQEFQFRSKLKRRTTFSQKIKWPGYFAKQVGNLVYNKYYSCQPSSQILLLLSKRKRRFHKVEERVSVCPLPVPRTATRSPCVTFCSINFIKMCICSILVLYETTTLSLRFCFIITCLKLHNFLLGLNISYTVV